jgi:AraC family transcriptional regulator
MECRIVEKPAFHLVGKSRKFTEAGDENATAIPEFWRQLVGDKNGNDVLMNLTQNRPGSVTGSVSLGVSMCKVGMEEFTYAIGVETPAKTVPARFGVIHIPAATWAVFESVGPMPGAIQNVTKRIFAEWFPSSGYEHPEYELEVYLPGDTSSNDYHCQVWIHINKKK